MTKEKVLTNKEIALREVLQAKEELECARQNFNYASGDFVDLAIEALNLAELRYNLANKKLHKLCEDGIDLPRIDSIVRVY